MKVAELLEQRRANWSELELMCARFEGRKLRRQSGEKVVKFAAMYRSACADLALADAYQLPSNTQLYLHQLVGRAHNQLYRSRRFDFRNWGRELFHDVPRRLFRDRSLWLAMALFWGLFLGSIVLARTYPEFANRVVGREQLRTYNEMYATPLERKNSQLSTYMSSFYTLHNTSIGLQSFAMGLLFGVGGLVELVFNAAQIGSVYGYMSGTPQWGTFANFTTAHGPFELTAIVMSSAAGMRLGFSQIDTNGMSRRAAIQVALREAAPAMGAAVVLFLLAALIEGFVSPSSLPYPVKLSVAIASGALLIFYLIVLGYGSSLRTDAGEAPSEALSLTGAQLPAQLLTQPPAQPPDAVAIDSSSA